MYTGFYWTAVHPAFVLGLDMVPKNQGVMLSSVQAVDSGSVDFNVSGLRLEVVGDAAVDAG